MKNAFAWRRIIASVLTMLACGESIAWTEWTPHVPYDITGKSPEEVYKMAQEFKSSYRKHDSDKVEYIKPSPYLRFIDIYINGVKVDSDIYNYETKSYKKYDAIIEKSLRNFNSTASLLEYVVECNCSLSASACVELGDLYMSKPQKITLNDPYNRALRWYAKAGELGIERGYNECARIWLIPDGGTEDERKTNACRYYQLAADLCLRQGRKTDAYIYVDKIRNLGYSAQATGLLDKIKSYKNNEVRKEN